MMNNAVFGKAIENVRKHRDIKLFTTEKEGIYYEVFHRISISTRNKTNADTYE